MAVLWQGYRIPRWGWQKSGSVGCPVVVSEVRWRCALSDKVTSDQFAALIRGWLPMNNHQTPTAGRMVSIRATRLFDFFNSDALSSVGSAHISGVLSMRSLSMVPEARA